MLPLATNRLANINDLRTLAKQMNIRLPEILSSKKLEPKKGADLQQPFVHLTKRDDELTDREYEEPRPTTKQGYTELWREVSAISDTDLPEESRAIMEVVQPIQEKLEQEYYYLRDEQERLSKRLQELYMQSHCLYEQLKELRAQQFALDVKRKNMLKELKSKHKNLLSSELYGLLPDQKEYKELLDRVEVLKKSISELNGTVTECAQQLHTTKKKTKGAHAALVKYFKEALKKGLDYRQFGISWIANALLELGVEPSSADFPNCLDEQSKRYLLTKIGRQRGRRADSLSHLNSERSIEASQSKIFTRNKPTTLPQIAPTGLKSNSHRTTITTKSLSLIGVGDSAEEDAVEERQMKRIYLNTKRFLNEIIKDRETSLNTKAGQYSAMVRMEQPSSDSERSYSEYQRIVNGYPRATYQLALKMLFGWDRSFVR